MVQEQNELSSILAEDIPKNVRDLIPIIGIESLIKLMKKKGGDSVYLPKFDRVLRHLRNRLIVSEFNGKNYKELALKYNFSVTWIRVLVDKRNIIKTGD